MLICQKSRKVIIPSILILVSSSTVFAASASSETQLELKSLPVKVSTDQLEVEKLDFRYTPQRFQACIGLPDDPYKTIAGSDGGLYYDYGGGPFYDFKTRIVADLQTEGQKGLIKQSLLDPRIPIVVTEQQMGGLILTQRAWAGAPQDSHIDVWSEKRVDYLWLTLRNPDSQTHESRIILNVDTDRNLTLNSGKTHLSIAGQPKATFLSVSPQCSSAWPDTFSTQILKKLQIKPLRKPSVSRNWGKPNTRCDERFRNILVGYNRPLEFRYKVKADKNYRLAFALIESWYDNPNKRPLEIRIEGETVRKLDLVGEFGRDTPVVLTFDAKDRNNDGLLEMGIYSGAGAADKNTILNALWIFEAAKTPSEKQILSGGIDAQALALYDARGHTQDPIKLCFDKTIPPGEEYNVLVTLPQSKQAPVGAAVADAQGLLEKAIDYWRNSALPYNRMIVPDQDIQGLLDSCIRNIYQARELRKGIPAFQVGPTCYRGTWAADGPFILEAITYLGRWSETRKGLELQVEQDEGPGGVAFSKKTGLRLWMIWRHAQLTGDWSWLGEMWTRVESNVNKIIEYRKMTMDDPKQANYGLMPIGFGDGGLGGRHREYTNVYWTLAGLKAAIQMAQKLNKSTSAWEAEYQDYWQRFDKSRNRDKRADTFGNIYVPPTMKGEQEQLPQRGAWSFMQSIFPGCIFADDDELMLGTMAMLDATAQEGLIYGTGWLANGIWNYAASFYGHAHLWLGHSEKAAATYYAFANHACPLLCWREEQNPRGQKESYVGDMPHNWASAEFIRLTRHMLILERGQELHLLEGMPTAWTNPGDKIQMLEIPTSFGPITLYVTMSKDDRKAIITVQPPKREPIEKIVLHLEQFEREIRSIKVSEQTFPAKRINIPTNKPVEINVQFAG